MSSRKNRIFAWLVGFAALGLAMGQAQAQETKNVKFVLDWAFQGQQAIFTIPVDDGTYAKYHLNVTVDRGVGSGDTVAKVASGAYDIGLADLYSMVRFNGENPDHKLIAVMLLHDKTALAVETKASSSIKTPQDLNGKTLASPEGDASRQLFPLFAAVNKLDQKSIKWINVSPALREPMLIKGEADAITGHITTVLMNIRALNIPAADIRVMPYADFGVPLFGHALIVKPDYAAKNPKVITDFIRATMHGLNVMIKNPDFAVATIKKRDPLINDAVEKDRIKMSLDYMFITPHVLKDGVSDVDPARLQRTLKMAGEAFGIKTIPTAAETYTAKYLPPRAELKIEQ